jgi:hypothetical protein
MAWPINPPPEDAAYHDKEPKEQFGPTWKRDPPYTKKLMRKLWRFFTAPIDPNEPSTQLGAYTYGPDPDGRIVDRSSFLTGVVRAVRRLITPAVVDPNAGDNIHYDPSEPKRKPTGTGNAPPHPAFQHLFPINKSFWTKE